MRAICTALLILCIIFPATTFARDYRHYDDDHYEEWHPQDDDRYYRERHSRGREDREKYYYSDSDRRRDSHKSGRRDENRAPAGWDIDPNMAKNAPNCHHYSLTVTGGKATARITPLPGKNYVQTHGQRVGYVCFEDSARLELGKLANPDTEVTFRLRDIGTFVFSRGDRGSKYKNDWYRTYWSLK